MKDLKKIEQSLEKLHNDFNSQLEALGSDSKEFHNSLIDLTAKYPEHKELIQFIVFINDKLETNQTMFSGVVSDSFNDIVKLKKDLLSKMIDERETKNTKTEEKTGFWVGVLSKVKTFKDIKIFLVALATIAVAAGVIFAPEAFLEVLKALAKIFV